MNKGLLQYRIPLEAHKTPLKGESLVLKGLRGREKRAKEME